MGQQLAPWSLDPGSSHAESRAQSASGQDSRAGAQSSQRWLAQGVRSCKNALQEVERQEREPVARAAALHQIGRAPYRICTVLFRLSPYFPIPYLQLRYTPKSVDRGREAAARDWELIQKHPIVGTKCCSLTGPLIKPINPYNQPVYTTTTPFPE